MHQPIPSRLQAFSMPLLFLLSVASCDEAVVGGNADAGSSPAIDAAGDPAGNLCQQLGEEICSQACECGGGDGCVVGLGDGQGAITYDDKVHCETFYVTLACQSPPNPDSYYESCLGTVDSCVEVGVGETVSAAEVSAECSNPNGLGISCGDDYCSLIPGGSPADEKCCVDTGEGDEGVPMCVPLAQACDAFNLSLACDGPEDCGGNACCGSVASGVTCSEEQTCPPNVAQYCHTSADCPEGDTCVNATYAGFDIQTCASL